MSRSSTAFKCSGPGHATQLPIQNMKSHLLLIASLLSFAQNLHAETKPVKALLIAGGCCHDYKGQHEALFKGIQARSNVQVDVYWTDDSSTNPPFPLFDSPDWAKGYDVIIHDECAASNRDVAVVQRILEVHRTIPAVHLHCAISSSLCSSQTMSASPFHSRTPWLDFSPF